MRPAVLVVFAIFALATSATAASAQEYTITSLSVDFDIRDDFTVRETIRAAFDTPVSGTLPFALNDAVRDIAVEGGTYTLAGQGSARILYITVESSRSLTISFTADRLVFQNGQVHHLFTELNFDRPVTSLHAEARLPAGYSLYSMQYKPENASIISDGKRIILSWNRPGDEPILFSVIFSETNSGNIWLAAALLVAGGAVLMYLHLRNKAQREFMRGFRADEKRVVAYMQEKRVALQSDVQKEFRFSRSKTMRIIMELEAKGLVRKERKGRTNRLYWTK